MKKFHPLALSLLSGLLLFAAWPVSPLTPLIFIAFVPLLLLAEQGIKTGRFIAWTYLAMLTWNACTTWWIWNASEPGAIGAILANSLIMCLPWAGFYIVKRRADPTIAFIALTAFWLSFEYFHLCDWGLSWPWLTIGNVFASHPGWVQWYEYTGVSGGGAWVLIANIFFYKLLIAGRNAFTRPLIQTLLVLVLPLAISGIVYAVTPNTGKLPVKNIVIVQPNIDPYEKLTTGTFDAQLQKLIRISESAIDSSTSFVVWPETALYMENPIDELNLKTNYFMGPLWAFMSRHPHINLLTGVESYRAYKGQETPTARNIRGTDSWFDTFNSAVILDTTGTLQTYHKTRLVPGVETLPPFLHFLDSWFEKFGGTTSGYAGQKERTVFHTNDSLYHIAPSVCYESIYGEFMSAYARNGANIIAVITNDGWWGNTPGYRQHLNYARLRSIETRRWLIRSANTGVSCVIDPKGNIIDPQPWLKESFIKAHVPPTTTLTFYVRVGDIISKLAMLAAASVIVWLIYKKIKKNG